MIKKKEVLPFHFQDNIIAFHYQSTQKTYFSTFSFVYLVKVVAHTNVCDRWGEKNNMSSSEGGRYHFIIWLLGNNLHRRISKYK
jgi:hypothetical protein